MLRYLKLLSRGFIVLLSMSFHLEGVGEIFYIHPQGNDQSGNGSSTKPWRSLHYATGVVKKVGDIIHVMKGVYVESASCLLAEGVNIEGEGEGSIIMCSEKADWTPIISATSPEGTDGNQHISGLTLDGQKLSSFWAIRVAGRSNVSIYNCTIVDFKDRGIIFDGRNDNKSEPPVVFARGNSFHDNIVKNCAAYNTENGIYGRGCLNIGGQDGMLIYNNTIVQDMRPDGYNGYPIKYSNDGYLKGIKIYNNIIRKIPFGGKFGGDNGWDFSIELWNILGGMEIYGNKIQGAVDLVNTSRNDYAFGIWFHDNTISQKVLNDHYESGIVFEVSTEAVIVENNRFEKLSGGILFNTQEDTFLDDIIIRKNIFSDIGRRTGNGNNGSAINLNRGVLFGDKLHYTVNNLSITENEFSAAEGNAPYYGIEITGAALANRIVLRKNKISGFLVSCLIANPAKVIDSILLEGNILSGNGNNNNPLFVIGRPGNYRSGLNTSSYEHGKSRPGYNIKQQLVRPIYYEAKTYSLISGITLLAAMFSLFFAGKNVVNTYAFGIAAAVFGIISCIDQEQRILPFIYVCFIPLCIYGWMKWSRKDIRKRNKLPISASAPREYLMQVIYFGITYVTFYCIINFLETDSAIIPWAESLLVSATFVAAFVIIRRKIDGWFWLIAATLCAVYVYYVKNYLITSLSFAILLFIEIWALSNWKRMLRILAKN